MRDDLNYEPPGIAKPGTVTPDALRCRERRIRLGTGDEVWQRATAMVAGWQIKKRVGFRVEPDGAVVAGRDVNLRFGFWRIRLLEPVRVIWIDDQTDHKGFGYGTRHGHPITGEEAFLVDRDPDGSVLFTVRSVSRVSGGRWVVLSPLIRLVQPVFLRRYARAALAIVRHSPAP